ncbi:glucokinase [Dyella nitratireducens]|uniref:Glucokinase n=1 Tax=Dyella nitratireducens TaxID=1849580 RepID=A0ABQ1GFZ5_9GAMM|nr:glucokinase [Dyella nitratireducens]GGA42880.1 glucokinase [Dyella nitratireducens]GLQ41945.1 glucokinase [Dyella nitratireducens]
MRDDGNYKSYSAAHSSSSEAFLADAASHSETVSSALVNSSPGNQEVFLAADVGGTHARIGLIAFQPGQGVPATLAYRVYKCADFSSFDAIVRAFCDAFSVEPQRLALACAGFLHEGEVVNNNLRWPIVPADLEKTLALSEVKVLNDFEALAYGTAYLDPASAVTLHDPRRNKQAEEGPVVVVGPGTGLGVAVRLPGSPPQVLATEAGHIQLAARVGREQTVLGELVAPDTHIPYDSVLSGPGLLRLYQAVCRLDGVPCECHEPAAITAAACDGTNAQAVETLQLFCGWLGSFAGDLAMLYGATGGIYVAGGFLSRMTGFMAKSSFVSRFLDKGVMRPFQQTVPVHVVDHAQLGVIGAASWLMNHAPQQAVQE